MTDNEQTTFPPAPAHIVEQRWKAMCECARLAFTIERLHIEGTCSKATILTLSKMLTAKRSQFTDEDFKLAVGSVQEFDGRTAQARDLNRMVRLFLERQVLQGSYISSTYLPFEDVISAGFPYFDALEHAYYIFVEEAGALSEGSAIDAPNGDTLKLDVHSVFSSSLFRFRTSGIQVADFHGVENAFEELDPNDITFAQRKRRKKDLQENLANVSLPVLDIYIPSDHADLRTLRTMLVPGSWHILGISGSPLLRTECPVLVGSSQIAEGDQTLFYLAYAGALPPYVEVRLRDIFSLAHIPDARFDEEGREEGGILPPDEPPDGQWAGSEIVIEIDSEQETRRDLPGLEA